jgi:diphthamide biosynthesis protein 7
MEVVWEQIRPYCLDSVEWQPNSDSVFAVGSYELVSSVERIEENLPAEQVKVGSISLFELRDHNEVVEKCTIDTAAVLDLKWQRTERPLLAAAMETGNIEFYEEQDLKLVLRSESVREQHDAKLSLALDWSPWTSSSIVSSFSSGKVAILDSNRDDEPMVWKAHDFEAWTCAFDKHLRDVVYSGSDDCLLRVWDARDTSSKVAERAHDGGVVSVQSCPDRPWLLATGSYDEYLRLWDVRKGFKDALVEYHAGGGVWRIKWKHNRIAAACMHAGSKVLEVDEVTNEIRQMQHFDEENGKHLAYGIDWRTHESEMVATGNFYNKRLCLWSV